jgi:transposase
VLDAYNRFYKDNAVCPVSYSTLKGWLAHWEQYGETPSETHSRHRKENLRFRAQPKRKKITQPMRKYLKELVNSQPWLYLDEVQEALWLKGGDEWLVHSASIWRVYVNDFHWSLKVFTARASQQNEEDRNDYRRALLQFYDPALFVFVDESSKGRNASRRRRAWGPRGFDNDISEFFDDKTYLFTLMGAADINGMVLDACEVIECKPDDNADPTRGTVDADRFVLWLKEKLIPSLGCIIRGEARSVVVMDNAATHHDPRVKELIEAAGATLIYTAAYSPDLMPIEFCFHQYKAYLRRYLRLHGREAFGSLHVKALASISRSNMCNYYRKVGCIRNVPPPSTDMLGEAHLLQVAAVLAAVSQFEDYDSESSD